MTDDGPDWLTVSDETAAIAAHRERTAPAGDDSFEFPEWFTALADEAAGSLFLFEDAGRLDPLRPRREWVVAWLTGRNWDTPVAETDDDFDRPASAIEREATAALVLCWLHEPRGRDMATAVLVSDDDEREPARKLLIRHLDQGFDHERDGESERWEYAAFLDDAAFRDALLHRLERTEAPGPKSGKNRRLDYGSLVSLCAKLDYANTSERFLELLQAKHADDRSGFVWWLSRGRITESLLDRVEDWVESFTAEERAKTLRFFSDAANEGPIALRSRSLRLLRERLTEPEAQRSADRNIVSTVAERATADDLPWLEMFVAGESRDRAKEPVVDAIARLSAADDGPDLPLMLADPQTRTAALQLALTRTGTAAPDTLAALEAAVEPAAGRERVDLANVFALIRGISEPLPESIADRLEHPALPQFAAAARKAGLLSDDQLAAAAETLAGRILDRRPVDPFDFLAAADSAIAIDMESGFIPVGYDELIVDFARKTDGRFRPDAVEEDFDEARTDEEYRVSFVSDGRLYTGTYDSLGDWFGTRFVEQINHALADAGHPQRFVSWGYAGQAGYWVFGEPGAVVAYAAAFGYEPAENTAWEDWTPAHS